MPSERLGVGLVRWAPKGTYSRLVGFCARRTIPRGLRSRLYTRFARRAGIELSEVERPLDEYSTFDAFFTRRLRSGGVGMIGGVTYGPVVPFGGY